MTAIAQPAALPRRIGRSIAAVVVGFVVTAVLSLATDQVLHVFKVYPPWGEPMCVTVAEAEGGEEIVELPTFTLQDFRTRAVAPAASAVQPAPEQDACGKRAQGGGDCQRRHQPRVDLRNPPARHRSRTVSNSASNP